jgi:hypothetical protein
MGFYLLLAPKSVATGVGFDLSAIQGDPFHGDQPFSAKHPHYYTNTLPSASLLSERNPDNVR